MPAFQLLSQKVHQLIRAYERVQEENKTLRRQLTDLESAHQLLMKKNQSLEETAATGLLGAQALSEDEKQNLRHYIDSVVDEIDKILTSLHE